MQLPANKPLVPTRNGEAPLLAAQRRRWAVTNMKTSLGIALLMLSAIASADDGKSLECRFGPITKTFGSTEWLIYGCSDERSVLVVSAPGNPAMPFYFQLSQRDGQVEIHGEGTGSKAASAAAYSDLEKLSADQIAALVVESRSKSASTAR